MGHRPKPWWRESKQAWYVKLNGQQIRLGKEKREAEERFHQLMLSVLQEKPRSPELLVCEVADQFLGWCKKNRAPRTFEWYEEHLQSFLDSLPNARTLTVAELKPLHVIRWVDSKKGWGANYRRGAVTAVQRAFFWGEKVGLLDRTPIRNIEKPKPERRDNPISAAEFVQLRAVVKDQAFGDLVDFCWDTGCRPSELRQLEARHVKLAERKIEIPPEEAKGKKRWRRIYLSQKAVEIIGRRMKAFPEGKLFRNTKGRPWTAFAIGCRFAKLKKKLGKGWAAYDFRHSWATRKLLEGHDHLSVAEALGHVNGHQLAVTYQHLNRHDDHLRKMVD